MFDTHCHLNFQAFNDNFNDVVKRAHDFGVNTILVPGTDLETSKKAIEIAESYENIYAAIGIHPTKDLNDIDLNSATFTLEELSKSEKIVAIGEIGLDYYRYRAGTSTQKVFFIAQLQLSLKLNFSVIIHNRHAGKDILDLLKTNWQSAYEGRMVFHCCEADEDMLSFAKKHTIFIGVDGDVTYDEEKKKFIRDVPLELLVIETDSPYIIPEPLRSENVSLRARDRTGGQSQRPNEPKNISYIAEKVSSIKSMPIEEINETTTKNAFKLFGLKEGLGL